jgi:hypothetical protein
LRVHRAALHRKRGAIMIPPRVVDHVQAQLGTLAILTRARQTDQMFSGKGRYEAEVYRNNKAALDLAWQRVAEFEQHCAQNGEDPQAVYAAFGQPPQLSPAAKDYLEGWDAEGGQARSS